MVIYFIYCKRGFKLGKSFSVEPGIKLTIFPWIKQGELHNICWEIMLKGTKCESEM